VAADLAAKGLAIGGPQVADELQRCAAEAKTQVMKG
jgi:hypothetical protein